MTNMNAELPAPEGSVEAVVNSGTPLVTMWRGSIPVQVPGDAVEEMRLLGLTSRSPDHIPGLVSEIKAYIGELPRLVDAVGAIADDREIDTTEEAALASLSRGLQLVNERVSELQALLFATYPVKPTGETVIMHRTVPATVEGEPAGEELIEVDPGGEQIEEMRKLGYSVKRGARGGTNG